MKYYAKWITTPSPSRPYYHGEKSFYSNATNYDELEARAKREIASSLIMAVSSIRIESIRSEIEDDINDSE